MPEEKAVCRGCGMVLRGKPYGLGGPAFNPFTGKQVKMNHYGGWVCSRDCDWKAAMALERTMPSNIGYTASSCMAYQDQAEFDRKWADVTPEQIITALPGQEVYSYPQGVEDVRVEAVERGPVMLEKARLSIKAMMTEQAIEELHGISVPDPLYSCDRDAAIRMGVEALELLAWQAENNVHVFRASSGEWVADGPRYCFGPTPIDALRAARKAAQ